MTKRVQAKIPEYLLSLLKNRAKATNRTNSEIIEDLLLQEYDKMKSYDII